MSLAQAQEALHHALWGKKGHAALDSKPQWNEFVSQNQAVMAPYEGYQMHLSLYESLLQGTVNETLNNFFPYCRQLLAEDWEELREQFRRSYPNRSYQLYKCAEKFPDFIAEQESWVERFPFLPELAFYEWLEVVVENASEQIFPAGALPNIPQSPEELAQFVPVWNAASHLQLWFYHIPELIQALDTDLANEDTEDKTEKWELTLAVSPKPTALFIYRDTVTYRARFFELNALTAQFVQLSQDYPDASYETVFSALKETTPALASIPMDTLLAQGLPLLQHCQANQILLASKPCTLISEEGN